MAKNIEYFAYINRTDNVGYLRDKETGNRQSEEPRIFFSMFPILFEYPLSIVFTL